MKRFSIVVALVLSACAQSRRPVEEVAGNPGQPIATFAGHVDLGAGTFRIEPASGNTADASRASLAIPEPAGVTVQNAGATWNDATGAVDHGCGSAGDPPVTKPSWGGVVSVTNTYGAGHYLSGVFARIESAVPAVSITSCTSSTGPAGWDLGNGLWSFGVVPGTSGPSTWAFNRYGGTFFTFYGSVYGAKVTPMTAPDGTLVKGQAKANGDSVVYPYESGLAFVDAAGNVTVGDTLPGNPGAVGPDPDRGRIWWIGWRGWAGYTDSAGRNGVDAAITDYVTDEDIGFGVAVDVVDPSVAWLLTSSEGYNGQPFVGAIRKASVGATAPDIGPATRFSGIPGGIAAVAVPDTTYTTLFVTNITAGTVDVWDTRGMSVSSVSMASGCTASPGAIFQPIILGPDDNLWFVGANAICKMPPGGGVTKVVDVTAPSGLCVGANSTIWSASPAGLARVFEGGGIAANPWVVNFSSALPATDPVTCAYAPGAGFWAVSGFAGGNAIVRFDLFEP